MKLSVLMITYNHDNFIVQALESVLKQKVNFEYEIVIGDDFSTDNTREIILEYAANYPDKIKPLLHEHNLGLAGKNNLVNTLTACNGDYIAILEGDDYWTSEHKLQEQIDLLDAHSDYSICFHNCEEFYEDGSKPSWNYCLDDQKDISTLEDLISKCNFIPTCSVVFRNNLFKSFPDWFYTLSMGDWTLHILNAQHGNILYINKVMGKHRWHAGGIWTLRNQALNILDVMKAYRVVDRYLNYKYKDIVSERMSYYYYELSHIYGNDCVLSGLKYIMLSLIKSTQKRKVAPKYLKTSIKMLIKAFNRRRYGAISQNN